MSQRRSRRSLSKRLRVATRLRLLLTLVAWIVGQWWAIEIDHEQRHVHFRIDDRGWLVTDLLLITRQSTEGWRFAVTPAAR